jgi:hypothetical protein
MLTDAVQFTILDIIVYVGAQNVFERVSPAERNISNKYTYSIRKRDKLIPCSVESASASLVMFPSDERLR